ncbi:P-TEFb-associated cyclin-dependent protein kinase Cdk9, partial [Perkinsus olseni]
MHEAKGAGLRVNGGKGKTRTTKHEDEDGANGDEGEGHGECYGEEDEQAVDSHVDRAEYAIERHLRKSMAYTMATLFPGKSYDRAGQLGEGSFGAVLTVYEADSGAEYAAKRFELNEDDGCTLSSGALIEVSFLSAIRMASLDKKGIIHLEDVCELTEEGEDILCAVVPKYNCSLEEAIQGTKKGYSGQWRSLVPPPSLLSIAIPLLEAVAVLHSNGVVHRDIKSANVMLTEELRPVAKYMPEGAVVSEKAPSDSAEHTGSVGTPTYMAPEIVEANGENLRYDSRVDSWSVGVVLLELFTGKVMEECKDRAAFRMIDEAKARMSDKPVPRIIKGLLEVEPHKRLKCSDAHKKLIQCSSHANKENSNEGFLLSDSSKPLRDYFGNYVIAGGAHAGELQEIRRFYHVLEMTNPTTIKAAMCGHVVPHHPGITTFVQ